MELLGTSEARGLPAGEDDYAHLNSLHLSGGDVIASFRFCNQVLRIDRSDGTGAVEWQLGGTSPPRAETTTYLEITATATA